MTRKATGKLGYILWDLKSPIRLKKKDFNACILPAMCCGRYENCIAYSKLSKQITNHSAIERTMLGMIPLRNEDIRIHTKVEDVIARTAKTRQELNVDKNLMQWRPTQHKCSIGSQDHRRFWQKILPIRSERSRWERCKIGNRGRWEGRSIFRSGLKNTQEELNLHFLR